MTIALHADSVPLHVDETGTIRVGNSRVTLDVVLTDYQSGTSPEVIARELDSLSLADVYGAISYFHRHREEIEVYLRRREQEAAALRHEIEASQPNRAGLKATLLSRLRQKDAGNASAPE
jgi:uncharacterized protein (DUF433 family)